MTFPQQVILLIGGEELVLVRCLFEPMHYVVDPVGFVRYELLVRNIVQKAFEVIGGRDPAAIFPSATSLRRIFLNIRTVGLKRL